MSGPVVLVDRDGWLLADWTTAGAAESIELFDAEDGEYVGVDAAGRRVTVGVRPVPGNGGRGGTEVTVEVTDDQVDADEVGQLLELALPVEQRAGAGRRSLTDCLSRLVLDELADHVPRAAAVRLRTLLSAPTP